MKSFKIVLISLCILLILSACKENGMEQAPKWSMKSKEPIATMDTELPINSINLLNNFFDIDTEWTGFDISELKYTVFSNDKSIQAFLYVSPKKLPIVNAEDNTCSVVFNNVEYHIQKSNTGFNGLYKNVYWDQEDLNFKISFHITDKSVSKDSIDIRIKEIVEYIIDNPNELLNINWENFGLDVMDSGLRLMLVDENHSSLTFNIGFNPTKSIIENAKERNGVWVLDKTISTEYFTMLSNAYIYSASYYNQTFIDNQVFKEWTSNENTRKVINELIDNIN